ncbi:hypothetical protein ACEOIB_25015 [Pseudomonas aeruginosa]|uniref:hypothetical protein n=1 Tax=Pseudomonas aeruginosa TaxID=287 RepID=UPI000EB5E432|nr:hypothetical protein [Pseudomonas aeruginosa]
MSEVKRFDHVNHAHVDDCEHVESSEGVWVTASDYDALAAKLAMAEDAAAKGDAARQQCGGMEMEIEELRAELAELRARVVVIPDAKAARVILDDGSAGGLFSSVAAAEEWASIWNSDSRNTARVYPMVRVDELAHLNGLTVSEGLVQGMAKFAREIICGALDGGSFDGADIQESAERHGLIAKQVMNEPCRGPEEYCACAWSTSFPAECYRVTPKLRALLNEDKENGNG